MSELKAKSDQYFSQLEFESSNQDLKRPMLQDGSNHQIDSDLSDELVLAKHRPVETSASGLTDELFLEQSLTQIAPLLPDSKPAIRDTLQPVYQPGTVILVLRTLVQSLRVVPYRQPIRYVASPSRLGTRSLGQTYQSDLFFPQQPANNRFFLCLACASITMMLLLWMGSKVKLSADDLTPPVLTAPQGSSPPTASTADVQPSVHKPQLHSSDPEKLSQPIEQKAGAKQAVPTSTKATQLSKVPLPANPQVPSDTVISVPAKAKPERIYVPIYQPPAQTVAAKPRVIYKASTPSVTFPSTSPLPSASASTHTLVGVLEFGDRSAALVNINQVTRRVSVGETVISNGWKLTKVAGQTAVLQRGDKLRSVYVGQTF